MPTLLEDRSYILTDGAGVEVARWKGIGVPVYRLDRPNENAMFRYQLREGRRHYLVDPGPLAAMVYRAMLKLG